MPKIYPSRLLWIFLLGSLFHTAAGQSLTVATYNVCNLFDTLNDPGVRDDVPTPASYRLKTEGLARVVGELAPDLLALCEVENDGVLRDLIAQPPLDTVPYRFVHYDSPDRRGIDVALLYRADRLVPIASEPIRVSKDFPTRDLLRAEFTVVGTGNRVAVYVAHLPSRRSGTGEAERMRTRIIALLGELTSQEEIGVIVLGDFNDNPDSKPVNRYLSRLRCLTAEPFRRGIGSYAWRDAWVMYDNIFVNDAVNAVGDARVFRRDWMLTPAGRFRGYPDRKISDHLPVYIRVWY